MEERGSASVDKLRHELYLTLVVIQLIRVPLFTIIINE